MIARIAAELRWRSLDERVTTRFVVRDRIAIWVLLGPSGRWWKLSPGHPDSETVTAWDTSSIAQLKYSSKTKQREGCILPTY